MATSGFRRRQLALPGRRHRTTYLHSAQLSRAVSASARRLLPGDAAPGTDGLVAQPAGIVRAADPQRRRDSWRPTGSARTAERVHLDPVPPSRLMVPWARIDEDALELRPTFHEEMRC